MIPKTIHFVWVGDQPKSALVLQCIASWKKYLPDYRIIEGGNEAFFQIDNVYAWQAFEQKKWAFVSDYIRLYALKKYGGFYFDADLEITADMAEFRELEFVTGYELYNGKVSPVTALMGAVKNQRIVSDLYQYYETAEFISDGGLNITPNTQLITEYFEKQFDLRAPYDGLKVADLSLSEKIYPCGYFCTPSAHSKNYAIHHFNGSWVDGYTRKTLFSYGRFSIIRFKKNLFTNKASYPLLTGEKLILSVKISELKTYGIVSS